MRFKIILANKFVKKLHKVWIFIKKCSSICPVVLAVVLVCVVEEQIVDTVKIILGK